MPNVNDPSIQQRRPVGGGEAPIGVIERDNNNNTTAVDANQTDPWFDREKAVDSSVRAPERDPSKVTGIPFAGEKMPSSPKPEPEGEPSLLNWVPGKKGPLN